MIFLISDSCNISDTLGNQISAPYIIKTFDRPKIG
jgi:hypothetical protein